MKMLKKICRMALMPVLMGAVALGTVQGLAAQDHGGDAHFTDQHRAALAPHYTKDIARVQAHPESRPQFARGGKVPAGYAFQPVPASYYHGAPPPRPGYQYGYRDGYVVEYNPTTRIVGDVLDLAAAATH